MPFYGIKFACRVFSFRFDFSISLAPSESDPFEEKLSIEHYFQKSFAVRKFDLRRALLSLRLQSLNAHSPLSPFIGGPHFHLIVICNKAFSVVSAVKKINEKECERHDLLCSASGARAGVVEAQAGMKKRHRGLHHFSRRKMSKLSNSTASQNEIRSASDFDIFHAAEAER